MRMILGFFFLGFHFLSWSQSYIYPGDSTISDTNGKVTKLNVFYFPTNMFVDTIKESMLRDIRKNKTIPIAGIIPKDSTEVFDTTYTKVDSLSLEWFSQFLYSSSEPILCNYPLNREIYRLTWLRSFHPGVIIRLMKDHQGVLMSCKKISGFRFDEVHELDSAGQLIRILKNEPKFDKDTIIHLDIKVFADFEKRIQTNQFIKIPNKQFEGWGCDGSEWILEMHKPGLYWVVNRWSPDYSKNPKFRELCDYLINISIFKDEERY